MTGYRIAIVGCGKSAGATAQAASGMAVSHIEAIRDNPALDAIAAFDDVDAARSTFCDRWSVPEAASWEDVVKLRPDAVLIASPTGTHADYLLRALDAGIPLVACEKPLVESAAIACEVVSRYLNSASSLMVYYPRRWISALVDVGADIRSGAFGAMLAGHGWYGNGIRNIGSHMIELVQRIAGPIRAVEATGRATLPVTTDDPTPDIRLRLDNDACILLQGYDYGAYALFEFDLLFERGRVRMSELGFAVERWQRGESPHYPGFYEPVGYHRASTDYADAARAFWHHAADVLATGRHEVDDGDVAILTVIDKAISVARQDAENRASACH